jgi:putative flippase GtrA
MVRKTISFGLVGVINAAVDASVFFAAINWLTDSRIVANVLAWLVAVSGSYVMNSYTTFAAESGRKLQLQDYWKFVASGILGMVANTATLLIVDHFAPLWVAKLVALGVSFVVNFSMSHFVIFPAKRAAENKPPVG